MNSGKAAKVIRLLFLLGTPGLILKVFLGRPTLLVVSGVIFGFAASILGTTAPEWRRARLLRLPVPPSFRLIKPYPRMAATFGFVALVSTYCFAHLVGTLATHPMLEAQIYFCPAAMWGSTFSLVALAMSQSRNGSRNA